MRLEEQSITPRVNAMITIHHRGNFNKTAKFLAFLSKFHIRTILDRYGQIGVEALASATPKQSGLTADSWSYSIESFDGGAGIYWSNDNINDGVNIAVILHYGHGTGTGGYVEGRGYITPAIQPVFDRIADAAWKEVTRA